MKSSSLAGSKDELDSVLEQAVKLNPDLILFFMAPSLLKDPHCVEVIKKGLAGRTCIGCSTAGEIGASGFYSNSVSFLAMKFETTTVRTTKIALPRAEESFAVGEALADMLKGPKLKAVIILCPGANVNGSAIAEALHQSWPQGPDIRRFSCR